MESHSSVRVHIIGLLISVTILPMRQVICLNNHCNFSAIFNFGDSNSNTGGLSAAFGQAPSPNGETFFHASVGRFSDGRLVIDFIAESLGLPYLSAYLDSVGSNFSHGANFATAGSTIGPQNTTMSQSGFSPISLNVQFVQYSDFHRRSQIFRKQEEDFSTGALYTFDIGQNDLTAGYKLNMSTEQRVYAQGGRSFWIHNMGPVGCLPYFLITPAQVDKFGCASPFNEVSQYFNLRLKEAVLPTQEGSSFSHYSLITQAKKLGFESPS